MYPALGALEDSRVEARALEVGYWVTLVIGQENIKFQGLCMPYPKS